MSEPAAARPIDVEDARKKFLFFRVMAFVVGVGLLVLCLEIVLHRAFDNDALAWWPQPHGLIFVVYVVSVALLGFAVRWSLGRMLLVMLAGCVPFLSFYVEHRMSADVQRRLAAAQGDRAGVGAAEGR